MNALVRYFTNEDGDTAENDFWHLSDPTSWDAPRTLCDGQVFGDGESGIEYEAKLVKRGGITCPKCLESVKTMKAVKL